MTKKELQIIAYELSKVGMDVYHLREIKLCDLENKIVSIESRLWDIQRHLIDREKYMKDDK